MRPDEEFYLERDKRTREYLSDIVPDKNIHVAIDTGAAETAPGQHLLLSLANMLARVHRHITFGVPDNVPLVVPTDVNCQYLHEALMSLTRAIDPNGLFTLTTSHTGNHLALAIGSVETGHFDWYLGADRGIAILDSKPTGIHDCPGTLRGAAMAACLGAAAVMKMTLGFTVVPQRISVWNYREGEQADPGPESLHPLDVGSVLFVGAGAVASSLAYWLHAWGAQGTWTIVDRDIVKLHNTNRGLLFTASDAGWPASHPRQKAEIIAAHLPSSRAVTLWYDEAADVQQSQYDVILALANERNVRTLLAHRNAPVLLHATTGANWLSQLHRHVAGTDDCIECRTSGLPELQFKCSTGVVRSAKDEKSHDASLPFLSAASGLMLATALQRLEAGLLMDDCCNDWRFDFLSNARFATAGRRHCRDGCAVWQPSEVRRRANRGNRWLHLDHP